MSRKQSIASIAIIYVKNNIKKTIEILLRLESLLMRKNIIMQVQFNSSYCNDVIMMFNISSGGGLLLGAPFTYMD